MTNNGLQIIADLNLFGVAISYTIAASISMKYNDIAKYAFIAMDKDGLAVVKSSVQEESLNSQTSAHMDKPPGFGGVIIGIREQVYSFLLLSFFFLEGQVFAAGFIPYVGKASRHSTSYFFLGCMPTTVSNTSGILLRFWRPLCFSNFLLLSSCELWCHGYTLPTEMLTFILQFMVIATSAEADHAVNCNRRTKRGAGLGMLPIFYSADTLL
ncbi:hypothetical protein NE237_022251 [Protea cynaroides]|uniref:Uncharacterized protein n=1 Tax=Protea cynaroides TaxID=273540 RepID=A0A9Q0K4A4_9MAGN|nr:hypothetical protein NE237_022251 [Protea cynaroides]